MILFSPSGEPNDIEDIPVLVIYSEEEEFDELEAQKNENIETIVMTGVHMLKNCLIKQITLRKQWIIFSTF